MIRAAGVNYTKPGNESNLALHCAFSRVLIYAYGMSGGCQRAWPEIFRMCFPPTFNSPMSCDYHVQLVSCH